MKVTIKDYLNVRVGKPSVNAPTYQYLAPGSEIEVDGQLYKGDLFDGIDTWLKDLAGNYYWSGGIEIPKTPDLKPVAKSSSATAKIAYDLRLLMESTIQLPPANGANIKIALLDSGISNHPALANKTTSNENDDTYGHGTAMAGIITGQDSKVSGIATGSILISHRVANGKNVDPDLVLSTLESLAKKTVIDFHVINMSLDVHPEYVPHMQKHINTLLAKGVVTVVAAGSNNFLNNISRLKDVVKVGAINPTTNISKPSEAYDIIFSNTDIETITINQSYDFWGGESSYTALTTGLISIFFSSKNLPMNGTRLTSVITFLNSIASAFQTPLTPFKPYKN